MEQDNKHNEFDKQFQDSFRDWEAQPPVGVWDKVEVNLEQEGKKRPGAWWWFSGAVLLLLGLGIWYFWPIISNQKPAPLQNSVVSVKPNNESHKSDSANAIIPGTNNNTNSLTASASNKMHLDSVAAKPITTKPSNNTSAHTMSANNKQENNTSKTTLTNNQPAQASNLTYTTKPTATQPNTSHPNISDSSSYYITKANTSKPKNNLVINSNSEPSTKIKKDSITTQKPAVVEESITSSTQSKPVVKKKDSISVKKDSTIQQKQIAVTTTKMDSLTKQMKSDSLTALKKTAKDSLKKDSLAKAGKKDSTVSVPVHLLSVSGFFSPEIAKIDVTSNNSKFNAQNVMPQVKYSAGLKLGLNLNKRLQVSIGLSYSQFYQEFHTDTVSFPKAISQPFIFNSALGNMSVPAATMLSSFSPLYPGTRYLTHYQYNQTVQFINIPVTARLNFGVGKLKPYITLGMNVQYALSQHAQLELLKELETDVIEYNTLEVRTLNFAASAGLGAEYDFSKHLGAYIEPDARFNLLSNSTNGTVKSSNSFIGCQTGITYLF
jgi:hypothetical protein